MRDDQTTTEERGRRHRWQCPRCRKWVDQIIGRVCRSCRHAERTTETPATEPAQAPQD